MIIKTEADARFWRLIRATYTDAEYDRLYDLASLMDDNYSRKVS